MKKKQCCVTRESARALRSGTRAVRKFRSRDDESISPPTDPLNDFAAVESIRRDVHDGSAGALYRPGRNRVIIARQRILTGRIGLARSGHGYPERSLLYFSRDEDKADLLSDESRNTPRNVDLQRRRWVVIIIRSFLSCRFLKLVRRRNFLLEFTLNHVSLDFEHKFRIILL